MGCNCGDNEYNITVNNNGNCEPTTPIYNITLANVGVNGYSPIVRFINETDDSFNISVDNITGTETSPAVPKLSYVIDQINNVNTTIGELGSTYLTINGSNAANTLNLNHLRLITNDNITQRVMTNNGSQLRISGQGLILDGYAQAGQARPNSITISPTGSSITIGNTHESRHNIIIDNTGAFYDGNEIATENDIPDITTKLNTDGSNATNDFTINGVELAGNYVYINNVSYGGINISQTNSDIYAKLEVDSSTARLSLPSFSINSGATGNVTLNTTREFVINGTNTTNKTYYHGTSSNNEIATKGDIPTVGTGIITILQGGEFKGSFGVNQLSSTTIELDSGGNSYTAGTGIDITNDTISIDSTVATKTYVDTGLGTKQDTLVSGTNIKTINNQSILGSGDITIQGGGAVDSVNGYTGVVVLTASDVGALATTDVTEYTAAEVETLWESI